MPVRSPYRLQALLGLAFVALAVLAVPRPGRAAGNPTLQALIAGAGMARSAAGRCRRAGAGARAGSTVDSDGAGLALDGGTGPSVTGSTFSNNHVAGLLGTLTQPVISGNTGSGSGVKALDCTGATFLGVTTLGANPNLAYLFPAPSVIRVPDGASLTFPAGAVIQLW